MLYAFLCYNDEDAVFAWSQAQDEAVMAALGAVQAPLERAGRLGPTARLMPTTAATTLRKNTDPPTVLDGPYAETKEQLLGFYVIDCEDLEGARLLAIARQSVPGHHDRGWIAAGDHEVSGPAGRRGGKAPSDLIAPPQQGQMSRDRPVSKA